MARAEGEALSAGTARPCEPLLSPPTCSPRFLFAGLPATVFGGGGRLAGVEGDAVSAEAARPWELCVKFEPADNPSLPLLMNFVADGTGLMALFLLRNLHRPIVLASSLGYRTGGRPSALRCSAELISGALLRWDGCTYAERSPFTGNCRLLLVGKGEVGADEATPSPASEGGCAASLLWPSGPSVAVTSAVWSPLNVLQA